MAQLSWTYVADGGKHFNVGLFHGPKTGHLLVHCNKQPVIIDFHVLESKTYPLFLDDELFELKVDLKKGQFSYGLEIDKQADTPRNRIRKKRDKKHFRQTVVFFAGLVGLATIFCAFMLFVNRSQNNAHLLPLLDEQGVSAEAKVYDISGSTAGYRLRFSFVAGNQVQKGKQALVGYEQLVSNLGFPIREGDEFTVTYLPEKPEVHRLEFTLPSEKLLEYYRELAIEKQQLLHSDQTREKAACMVDIAYEQKGIMGLADFYNQDIPVEENELANELTYKRLIRDVPFKKAQTGNCL